MIELPNILLIWNYVNDTNNNEIHYTFDSKMASIYLILLFSCDILYISINSTFPYSILGIKFYLIQTLIMYVIPLCALMVYLIGLIYYTKIKELCRDFIYYPKYPIHQIHRNPTPIPTPSDITPFNITPPDITNTIPLFTHIHYPSIEYDETSSIHNSDPEIDGRIEPFEEHPVMLNTHL